MKTLLGELSDEILEHIIDYISNRKKSLLPLSCVSQQFRRVWKRTTFGIVFNMIIELNYNMLKHSYSDSLDDQVEIGKHVKEMIVQHFSSKEHEQELEFNQQKTPLLIEKLKKKKNQSPNFTNAISKIIRFDYGEEDKVEYGVGSGMEIEFENPNGMIQCWYWRQIYLKHGRSERCFTISKSLPELELTDYEWNVIITTAGKYVDLDRFEYHSYTFKKRVFSVFIGYLLDVGSEID